MKKLRRYYSIDVDRRGLVTLHDASRDDGGGLVDFTHEALHASSSRDPRFPQPAGLLQGTLTRLYRVEDLIEWERQARDRNPPAAIEQALADGHTVSVVDVKESGWPLPDAVGARQAMDAARAIDATPLIVKVLTPWRRHARSATDTLAAAQVSATLAVADELRSIVWLLEEERVARLAEAQERQDAADDAAQAQRDVDDALAADPERTCVYCHTGIEDGPLQPTSERFQPEGAGLTHEACEADSWYAHDPADGVSYPGAVAGGLLDEDPADEAPPGDGRPDGSDRSPAATTTGPEA